MRTRTLAQTVLLAALLVLAGCSTGVVVDDTTPTDISAATPTATPTSTATPAPDNPWQQEVVTVSISNHANDRDLEPLLDEALTYWNEHAAEHGEYTVEFELAADATDADIRLVFQENVYCGDTHDVDDTLGCAPIIESDNRVSEPQTVYIKAGYTNTSTVDTMKHEFGHVLGVEHDDEPEEWMRSQSEATQVPQPDASKRAVPWISDNLTVHVDLSNESADHRRRTYDRQIDYALDYYSSGADGAVPDNVTFTRTDNRSAADVVIVTESEPSCSTGATSCGSRWGADLDEDDDLEYYTRAYVGLYDIDGDAYGWHVGYWLGFAFGAESVDDLPEVFRDADYSERRSDWWR